MTPFKGRGTKIRACGPARISYRVEQSPSVLKESLELAKTLGIHPITAKILISRGICSSEEGLKFISPVIKRDLPDPFTIKSINQAAELILESVKLGEQITIYCDFDVDGLSAGSELFLYLRALGAKVSAYVPNRFTEGYGLVSSAIPKIARRGSKLLITVDCGISSVNEISLAKSFGMKVLVLDHHIPREIPPADVVVDPAQEGCPFGVHQLAAAGLVWMLLIVLRAEARKLIDCGELALNEELPDPRGFLDLAALGTICDMVPLVGTNRLLAHRGIELLRRAERPGIAALMQVSGIQSSKRFGSGQIAFGIGPRLNAAGRMSDAKEVFDLLICDTESEALEIAERIDRLNNRRQSIEEQVRQACLSRISENMALAEKPALAMYGDDFHIGVIGIVAQRLVEEFYRPAAVMAPGDINGSSQSERIIKGSVRGVEGFHVAEVLQSIGSILIAYGGHQGAGGFSLHFENLDKFEPAFVAEAQKRLTEEMLVRRHVADVICSLSDIDFDLVSELSSLSPFGVGNPSPLLVAPEVTVESVVSLAERHVRVRLGDGRNYINGVAWGQQGHPLLVKGNKVNVAFHPELNTYKGITSVQLNIREIWQ